MVAEFEGPCGCAVRDERLVATLVEVWEASVRATHMFLGEEDISRIRMQVHEALAAVDMLYVMNDAAGCPVAFMGAGQGELEMLFVHPDCFGCGIGSRLLAYAVDACGVKRLCVNEDNPRAAAFYARRGFSAVDRLECDGFGNRFPLLVMELENAGGLRK